MPYLGVQGIPVAQHVQDLPLGHVEQHAGDLRSQRLRVLLLNQRKHMPTCGAAPRTSHWSQCMHCLPSSTSGQLVRALKRTPHCSAVPYADVRLPHMQSICSVHGADKEAGPPKWRSQDLAYTLALEAS